MPSTSLPTSRSMHFHLGWLTSGFSAISSFSPKAYCVSFENYIFTCGIILKIKWAALLSTKYRSKSSIAYIILHPGWFCEKNCEVWKKIFFLNYLKCGRYPLLFSLLTLMGTKCAPTSWLLIDWRKVNFRANVFLDINQLIQLRETKRRFFWK